jgi:hypothetical protein
MGRGEFATPGKQRHRLGFSDGWTMVRSAEPRQSWIRRRAAAGVSGQVQLEIAAPGTAFPRRKALGVFASGHLNIWKHQTANASNAIGHVQPLNSRKFSEPVRDA